jgi:mannose-6-phosphate isomerase
MELPDTGTIGEALVTADDAIISAGDGAGHSLGDLVRGDPDGRLGTRGRAAVGDRAIFPLLVKLIDAREHLSIQVHPDDTQAVGLDRLGKTEAWHVLAADPGAELFLGLRSGVEVTEFAVAANALDGSSAPLLRSVPAQVGTTVMVPAGTVHALGAGVVVYEIQQPSDVTFRLDDWGRLDAAGHPRETHLDDGLAVMQPGLRPELVEPARLRATLGERHLLAACRYFALERIALPAGAPLTLGQPDSPVVLTVLSGEATIGAETLQTGQTAVIWPDPNPGVEFLSRSPLVALISSVPDLQRDIVDRARRSGLGHRAIANLGGPLNDVGGLL